MDKLTLEQLLDKAIVREEEAYDFYKGLLKRIEDPTAKDALGFLADEEKKHKEFLIAYKRGDYAEKGLRMSEVIDYKIAQYMDKPDPDKDIETKDVYLVAAHRELNSYNFYNGLAEVQPEGEVKQMLIRMAGEEMKHKEKVEYLYANAAFPQTAGG